MARRHRTRRRRLPRPWYWVLLSWAVGGLFVLLGLLMVSGDPDETGTFHLDALLIGAVCVLLGTGFCYAFAWAPRAWFQDEALLVRQLGEQRLRVTTTRVEPDQVAAVRDGGHEHDFLPLRTTLPVLILTTGEDVELGGHSRYVMPWRSSGEWTSRDIASLRRWAESRSS